MTITNGAPEQTGRPVDIEIVPRAHAILSASGADRWMVCTPSARIEELLPDRPSAYASDGTAAHAFAELRLRYLLGENTKAEYLAAYSANKTLYSEAMKDWDHTDWDAIDNYVNYVMAEAKRLDAVVHIEARVDYSKYARSGFGTSDALLVSKTHKLIKSIDLKFGKGVPVDATDNRQAKLYALGGVLKFDPNHEIDSVEWAIVQPRLNYIGEDGSTVTELLDWAENVVAPAAALAWEGKGDLVPTEKGCRFCKAAATCRARAAQNVKIAMKEFGIMPDIKLDDYLMTPDEVARVLPMLDGYMQWANAVKAYALEITRDKGKVIPGYKLVRGRANRGWAVPQDQALAELKGALAELAKLDPSLTVSETDLVTEPELKSVAQVEKALGKKVFTQITSTAKVVTTPLGAPTLVPETDGRQAINAVKDAQAAFGIENK